MRIYRQMMLTGEVTVFKGFKPSKPQILGVVQSVRHQNDICEGDFSRCTNRQTNRPSERRTGRPVDLQADRPRDAPTERPTETNADELVH